MFLFKKKQEKCVSQLSRMKVYSPEFNMMVTGNERDVIVIPQVQKSTKPV